MSKIIIGIHGLGNKVPGPVLEDWWRQSIQEGLRNSGNPRPSLKIKLVYWADRLYDTPMDPNETNEDAPFFVSDPYVPARPSPKKDPEGVSAKLLAYLEKQIQKVYLNKDLSINYMSITDLFIRHFFRDLDIYYSKTCLTDKNIEAPAKDVIRELLGRVLKKYRRNKILLIAHSMGSIVAFDTLTWEVPHIKIDTLVTIGSPLGLPAVMVKILAEQQIDYKKDLKIKTPENIKKNWYNFFDPDDRVSLKRELADDYVENTHHVRPIDQSVFNDYEYNGKTSAHQAYGYLRTPQTAQVITDFLNRGMPRAWIWFSNKINRWLQNRRADNEIMDRGGDEK
ncbi:MAG: hypothetical protein JW932_15780 [Deltaproteobacteria bacterium]|nr:hypothetical protein [Deltaproteobacteria bacterium]